MPLTNVSKVEEEVFFLIPQTQRTISHRKRGLMVWNSCFDFTYIESMIDSKAQAYLYKSSTMLSYLQSR